MAYKSGFGDDAAAPQEAARRRHLTAAKGQVITTAFVLLLCGGLVLFPVIALFLESFNTGDPYEFPPSKWGLGNYAAVLENSRVILDTVLLSGMATFGAIVAGIALSWTLTRTDIPGRTWIGWILTLPYYLSPLVGALAWGILAAPTSGWLNQLWHAIGGTGDLFNIYSLPGIAFVMALFEGPVAYVMITAAMRSMDPSLEECSRVLGAGKWRTLRSITLPLLKPAVLGASLFVFSEMLGSFAAAMVLGLPARIEVVTTAIWNMTAQYPPDYGRAAALGISLFGIMLAALYFYRRTIDKGSFTTVTGKAYRPRVMDVGRWSWILLVLVVFYILISVVLPILAIAVTSFQNVATVFLLESDWTLDNYRTAFSFGAIRSAIGNSLVLGLCVASFGVVAMVLLVWIIYRSKIWGSRAIESLVMFPQSVPRMVFGLALLWAWLNIPIGIYGTLWLLGIAYFTVLLPLGVRALSGVILQIDKSLEECARVCGASWGYTIRTVTIPLLKPGIIAAWFLLFIASVRELGASMFLTSAHSKVLSPSILSAWITGGSELTAALAVIQSVTIVLAFAVIFFAIGKINNMVSPDA